MNTCATDDEPLEIDRRDRYRELLRDSQRKAAPYHYDFHGEPTSLWECVGWTAFAAVMLAGLALALTWGLS